MPRKIRQLIRDLTKAGFQLKEGGKGSHRKFAHDLIDATAIIPGQEGDDAKPYLEKQVRTLINEVKEKAAEVAEKEKEKTDEK